VLAHPLTEVNLALLRQFSVSVSLIVTLMVFWVIFLTMWRLALDNSIQKRCLEAPYPEGDTSLCLIAMVLSYWTTGAFRLEIHSWPELSQQCREKLSS
jgi:uncharacterized membrane protein YphA (DoxX/SURF4 family)